MNNSSLSEPAIDLQKMPILATKKNHLFRWSSFWSWRVCKQVKFSHLGHRKPDASKTSHCLVRILVKRHNWEIFLRKWARRGRYSHWRSLSGHVERIFFSQKLKNWIDIDNIWFQQDGAVCRTAEATLDVLQHVFEDCIINRRAFVIWPPRSCDLTPLDYYLWGAIKDKCYADKPDTIKALKDNIR